MNPDAFRHDNVRGFRYLHNKTTEGGYQWMGDASIEIDTLLPQTITEFYHKLAERANRLGANAFRVKGSDIFAYGENKKIEISLFYLNRENFDENNSLFVSNKVYIFGFLGYHEKISGYKILINGQKYLMEELRYMEFELPADETLTIKFYNGVGSTKLTLHGSKEPKTHYLKFNLVKRTFTRGAIREHHWSFGEFLIRILDSEKEDFPIKV